MNFHSKQERHFSVFYVGNESKTQITLVLVIKTGNSAEARPYSVRGIEDNKNFWWFQELQNYSKFDKGRRWCPRNSLPTGIVCSSENGTVGEE